MSQDCKSLLIIWTITFFILSLAPVVAAKESSQDSSEEGTSHGNFSLPINLLQNKFCSQGMQLYLMALDGYFVYRLPLLAL